MYISYILYNYYILSIIIHKGDIIYKYIKQNRERTTITHPSFLLSRLSRVTLNGKTEATAPLNYSRSEILK